MTGLDAGVAWFAGADHVRQGTVCGVFGRACYLRLGDRLLALCRADVVSGPLHLRIPVLPAVRVGDPVVFQSGWLSVGSLTIAVDRTPRWAPAPLEAQDLRRRTGNATSSPPHSTAGLDDVLEGARERVVDHDLAGLALLLGGRGPGLTPAGDDLLAGVLVIDAVLHPGNDAAREAAARAVRTTDVAAAFLHWAARGQCIAPVHDVLSAVAERRPDREAAARATLLATGASSGAALLLGLDLALRATTLTPAATSAPVRAASPHRAPAAGADPAARADRTRAPVAAADLTLARAARADLTRGPGEGAEVSRATGPSPSGDRTAASAPTREAALVGT